MSIERYKRLVKERQNLSNKETWLEKQIFASKPPQRVIFNVLVQKWNGIKHMRREIATEVAYAWFNLTDAERTEINAKFIKGHKPKK